MIHKCASSISTMEFLHPSSMRSPGSLRNSRGTKVTVCLVDTALIVGRQVSRPGIGKVVQVYRELSTRRGDLRREGCCNSLMKILGEALYSV